jgi:hypothetical protein
LSGLHPELNPAASADGHTVKPLSDLRRADARSAQIGGPDCIVQCFQVNAHSGEPVTSSRARNLLSKHDCRPALGDKSAELWPQVPLVCGALSFARLAERLAGAASGPDFRLVRPSGELERVLPTADPGEEMHSAKPGKLIWTNIANIPLVDRRIRKQVSQPLGGKGVKFVEVGQWHRLLVSRLLVSRPMSHVLPLDRAAWLLVARQASSRK